MRTSFLPWQAEKVLFQVKLFTESKPYGGFFSP